MFFSNFLYSISNKINHLSILLMYFFNIRFKVVDLNYQNAEIIKKKYLDSHDEFNIPKIIWFYWDDEELPFLIKKCFYNIKKTNLDYEVFLLNRNNITSYVDIDLNMIEKESIQHQSDYIRLCLLKKYGGVWVDASIMMFRSVNYYVDILNSNKCGFLAFYCPDYILDNDNPVFENWFMISSRNNKIICEWLDELDYCFRLGSNKYVNNIMDNKSDYIQKLPNPFYFFSYIAAQKAIRNNAGYILVNAYHTAFYYHIVGGWDIFFRNNGKMHYTKLIKNLTLYKAPKSLPVFIKLTGGDRDFINGRLKFKLIKFGSILDNFLRNE